NQTADPSVAMLPQDDNAMCHSERSEESAFATGETSRSLVASVLGMTAKVAALFVFVTLALPANAQRVASSRDELPVLSLPDPRLDDTTAYEGYLTRFYHDSRGNTLQIYLRRNEGRVVNLWADAANESIGFTARDSASAPAPINWTSEIALTSDSGGMRVVSYGLTSSAPRLRLGWFLLGTMRIERDFQYWHKHLDPFTAPAFHVPELDSLVVRLSALPADERRRELALLHTRAVAELRARLEPTVTIIHAGSRD